jgi:hypothetical protein
MGGFGMSLNRLIHRYPVEAMIVAFVLGELFRVRFLENCSPPAAGPPFWIGGRT